ncbi:MAG: DUF4325 domain-containing protein [Candidatus Subteraquimicrobiales bacterium]|nr:DUF4325 domain-containing protein [Candidatus Subteraquimicrobiales bacterium]
MNLKDLILKRLKQKRKVKASEIIKETGFSRVYVNRFFKQLRDEEEIVLVGKANKAHYVLARDEKTAKKGIKDIRIFEKNKDLAEHDVLRRIERETGIFTSLRANVKSCVDYAFSEMLNNAIEHSKSPDIHISMSLSDNIITFTVSDWGIGIFNNIRRKKHLKSDLEAVQDLIKGKQTTAPLAHSGEGIFFTSKVADKLTFLSSDKKLLFDNAIGDIFLENAKRRKGTTVNFTLSVDSDRNLTDIFKAYTDDSYGFSKTIVDIKLYKANTEYISRSQARRVLAGLEKFKKIVLDFRDVKIVGQAFADEVFRIWRQKHPNIDIEPVNTNENIEFIIKHVSPE